MATAEEIKTFIQTLGKLAVVECNNRIANGKGFVLPSVCIAQSAIETGWGTAGIMVKANAFFGIKAGGSWTGAVYRADTWEVADGEAYNTTANFRAYSSLADSVRDYYDLIGNASRYSNALSFGTDQSKWKTPKECITAIWAGGYATDTLYVEKIMSTINARNLFEWDQKIDGISNVIEFQSYIFTKADFKQGSLIITDGGRSVGHNTEDQKAIALDWEKAIQLEGNTKYVVTQIDPYELYIVRLIGDSPSIDSQPYKSGDTISIQKGEKVGFYLKSLPVTEEVTNEETGEVTTETTYPDLVLSNIEILNSIFQNAETYPDGAESYGAEIAFFVKIG